MRGVGLLALAFAIASVLHYYGDLRFEAAWLISIAFSIVAVSLHILSLLAAFKPYRLIIGINYAALWEDLKLTPAEGPEFENFTFTAISAALYKRSDEREFSSMLDLYKDLPCGAPAWVPGFAQITNVPTFFFRPARGGYQFGLHVQEEWWTAHSPQLAKPLRELRLGHDNTIVLGFLPAGYLPEHVSRYRQPTSIFYRFDRRQRRWKEKLSALGWTMNDDYPEHINHRYLGVGYVDL